MLFAIFALVVLLFAVIGLLTAADLRLVGAHFAVGAALLIYGGISGLGELRELFRRDSSRRSARLGGNALVQLVLVGVIVALLAVLSLRHPLQWDWTEAGEHTLAEATTDVLNAIPEGSEVEIYAFATSGSEADASTRAILGLYEYEGERLSVTYLDPVRRPELAKHFDVHSDGVMIVCAGSCESATATARVTEASEQEITTAVRSVISERRKVYLLEGHGESDPASDDVEGLGRAKLAMEDENLEVETLLLANRESVPEDADAVLIVGPTHSLLERELLALDAYLHSGGGVGILVDPIVVTNLETRLRDWGVELGNDVIVDREIDLFMGPRLGVQTVVTQYGDHPVTAKMEHRPTSFQLARSVRPAGGAGEEVAILASTGPSAWGESDVEQFSRKEAVVAFDPASDLAGPVSVAVARSFAVDDSEDEGRLVVVGDADFARNRHIADLFNADLLLNTVSWLVGEESFITIERRQPRASRAVMTATQLATFRYLSIFVLPEGIVLLGILAWWRRRS